MKALTDSDLVVRVTRFDDRGAFEELVRRHQSRLRASMRRLTAGNIELADDVAQEAFILAWRNLGQFRADAKFSTWLYRIGFNVWQSTVRKKQEVLRDDMSSPSPEPSCDAESEQVGIRRDLDRAMAALSIAERDAIIHCYYQDLSHEEAAAILGLPLGTLKTHVLKAKEKMRISLHAYASGAA